MNYTDVAIDRNGNCVSNVTVKLYAAGSAVVLDEVTTNSRGEFTFTGVSTGSYDIKVWFGATESAFREGLELIDSAEIAGGLYTLEPVQDITELKALDISGVADKSQLLVEDENIIYRWDAESVLAENLPYIVIPDSAPASGRWFRLPSAVYHSDLIDDEATKHRLINDSGTSTTELFSASNILAELGLKADEANNAYLNATQAWIADQEFVSSGIAGSTSSSFIFRADDNNDGMWIYYSEQTTIPGTVFDAGGQTSFVMSDGDRTGQLEFKGPDYTTVFARFIPNEFDVDTINEVTTDAGVTIEGTLFKDDDILILSQGADWAAADKIKLYLPTLGSDANGPMLSIGNQTETDGLYLNYLRGTGINHDCYGPITFSVSAGTDVATSAMYFQEAYDTKMIVDANGVSFPDNKALLFGTGYDTTILYDGTDLLLNPAAVGTGSLKVGDATNHLEVKSDGEVRLAGTARVEKCIPMHVGAFQAPGVNPADVEEVGIGFAWGFDDTTGESISTTIHLPSDMDRSAVPHVCIDWAALATTGTVVWQVEYLYVAEDGAINAVAQETLSVNADPSVVSYGLVHTTLNGIDVPGSTDHAMIIRISRLPGDASDDMTGDALLKTLNFMYIANTLGMAT